MTDHRRTKTIDLKGNPYAKVADRLKLFREDFPKSKIETEHVYNDDETVEFKAWVWRDKADYIDALKELKDAKLARSTADADGNSKGTPKGEKHFEKLQTIAVGRALALLGYLASGEIASFEEMEEFQAFKTKQSIEAKDNAIAAMQAAPDIETLRSIFQKLGTLNADVDIIKVKDERKAQLSADHQG